MPICVCELDQGNSKCEFCDNPLTDTRLNVSLEYYYHNPDNNKCNAGDYTNMSFCNNICFKNYMNSEIYPNIETY